MTRLFRKLPIPPLALTTLFVTSMTMMANAEQTTSTVSRIPLQAKMLLSETAIGDTSFLVDEQDTVGDPASGTGKRPERPFFAGWTAWQYPLSVIVDLGVRHHVTKLFFYNESGESEITVSTGKPFEWKAKAVKLSGYQTWVEVPVDTDTRYVRVTLLKPTSLPEMVAYGTVLEKPTPATKPVPQRTPPTMDQFIGMNAFIDDPLDKIAGAAGLIREYHNWSWDVEGKDGKRRYQPSGAGGGGWFFDDYYAGLKKRGVTVCPAIQGNIPALFGATGNDSKPVTPTTSTEDPASYQIHAAQMFQFAARYGATKVDDSLLDLAADQLRLSGLGLLQYVENWNEPDRTWSERAGWFQPYELAAMSSADYDGHRGKMGKGIGVKTADPNIHLVMGGLSGLNLDYLRAIKLWADYHRGPGDFPADVINLHHYSSSNNEQWFKPGGYGISPEDDHLREKMEAFTKWRDAELPGREVWLTEFGYDTNPGSPLHAPTIGTMDAEHVQAIWLVRAYMALAAARVDRAAMFMLRDTNRKDTGVFATCGLVTEKGEWKPKPSWFYLATLKKRLAGMRFHSEIPSGNKEVRIYRFTGAGGKSAYAVWCMTSKDQRISGISVPVEGKSATRVEFVDGSMDGQTTPIVLKQGKAIIDVREQPTILLVP